MYSYVCEKCGKKIETGRRFESDAKHGIKEDGEYCGGNLIRKYQPTTVIIKGKR